MAAVYGAVGMLVGGLTFLAAWAYAVATYGFFLGVGLGWLPAGVIAYIVGFMWPIVAGLAALAFLL